MGRRRTGESPIGCKYNTNRSISFLFSTTDRISQKRSISINPRAWTNGSISLLPLYNQREIFLNLGERKLGDLQIRIVNKQVTCDDIENLPQYHELYMSVSPDQTQISCRTVLAGFLYIWPSSPPRMNSSSQHINTSTLHQSQQPKHSSSPRLNHQHIIHL